MLSSHFSLSLINLSESSPGAKMLGTASTFKKEEKRNNIVIKSFIRCLLLNAEISIKLSAKTYQN